MVLKGRGDAEVRRYVYGARIQAKRAHLAGRYAEARYYTLLYHIYRTAL